MSTSSFLIFSSSSNLSSSSSSCCNLCTMPLVQKLLYFVVFFFLFSSMHAQHKTLSRSLKRSEILKQWRPITSPSSPHFLQFAMTVFQSLSNLCSVSTSSHGCFLFFSTRSCCTACTLVLLRPRASSLWPSCCCRIRASSASISPFLSPRPWGALVLVLALALELVLALAVAPPMALALDLAQALQVLGARTGTGAGAGARILSGTRCGAPVAQALALEVGIDTEVQELGASNNPCDGGIRPRLGSGLGLGYPRSLMRSAPKWCWCWSW